MTQLVDLVVFDMIGTTITASDRIPEAFERAFAAEGIALTPDDIQSIRGRSKVDAIRELLAARRDAPVAEDETQVVYDSFKRFLLDCYRTGPLEPIAGATATFDWCRGKGIGVALTTGFDRELAALLGDRRVGMEDVGAIGVA